MTLIIKQLVIRGEVADDHKYHESIDFQKEEVRKLLDDMKKEIKGECTEKMLDMLESFTNR